MASEIQAVAAAGVSVYALIRNSIGQIWNMQTSAWESYLTSSYANYKVTMTQQGTASGYYTGNFPTQIVSGVYSVQAKQQITGSALESDPIVGVGDLQWAGTVVAPLSSTATSTELGQYFPQPIAYGVMVQNFPFKLVSSADHVTPFTSGICSGQISRNGGGFGALQSGLFTEIGQGWYKCLALTSGDIQANTVALMFSANGISGGTADTRDYTFILNPVSGH